MVLDHPYVSEVLEATLARLQVPVLLATSDVVRARYGGVALLDREAFFTAVGASKRPRLYTNSEHPLAIIRAGLETTGDEGGGGDPARASHGASAW